MRRLFFAAVAAVAVATPAMADTYEIDFFPELPQPSGLAQLLFVPAFVQPNIVNSQITSTTFEVGFTTIGTFDAANLQINLAARVPSSPSGGFITLTGADLGWSGQGSFTGTFSTADLNGTVSPGLWGFDLMAADGDPPVYSGEFTASSRIVITYIVTCPSDFDRDGVSNVIDLFAFLNAWFTQAPGSDFDNQGGVNITDLFAFLRAWFAGCA